MTSNKIDQAMVLAAGLGTRMRPITNTIPKPLVQVSGKTLLDHALDSLAGADVHKAAVNVHYLADQIEQHTKARIKPQVLISDEREILLDSGGGVKRAIVPLSDAPFFILNADSFWIDSDSSNLMSMQTVWNADQMDMQLLVAPKEKSVGFDGKGDFFMAADGKLQRRGNADSAPYVYAGAIITKPELFDAIQDDVFSLNRFFDDAIATDRLFGHVLDGLWLHVGTPAAIEEAEQAIAAFRQAA